MEDTLLRELETAVSEYDYRISKSSITADLAAYNKEKKKIEDKRKRLADLYEDDMITKEEYQQETGCAARQGKRPESSGSCKRGYPSCGVERNVPFAEQRKPPPFLETNG